MKSKVALAILSVIMAGCAGYKELVPDPMISPLERGYIELKQGKDNFELEQGNKYFMKFPMPLQNNFYLVLATCEKDTLYSYLTANMENGNEAIIPIPDETASSDSLSVYAIDRKVQTFYWVIDTVRYDVILTLKYRYVPKWRYTFENKYTEYRGILASNIVDRSTYNSIDANFDLDRLDFGHEISFAEGKYAKLRTMNDELLRIEGLFPEYIALSKDTAYEKYIAFRKKADDELAFQDNYIKILKMFKKERDTRGSVKQFLEDVPYYTGVVTQRSRFPAGVIAAASRVLLGRLSEVAPYLNNILKQKDDITEISPVPSLDELKALSQACGQGIPLDLGTMFRFIDRFNTETDSLMAGSTKFADVQKYFNAQLGSASESFYSNLIAKATEIKNAIPEPLASTIEPYGNYGCAVLLATEIAKSSSHTGDLLTMYETAGATANQIRSRSWASAETELRDLYEIRDVSHAPEIPAQHAALVKKFESEMFEGVKSASEQRIDAFVKAHEAAIDEVPSLYADSSFLPVYQLTFSSLGAADLAGKRKQITSYLDQIKYIQFPEKSIKTIYEELLHHMSDRGVEKARAIVAHGKFYRGTDKQVKGLIVECDVNAAKWIIRPKEYRKLFALPVTSNAQGVNEYLFRVQLQIPSDAQFPVYDVNLKLPQDIAEKSENTQWYESITIDKKPIKNEGRYRITSPTVENNYETLITPVQMDKEGKNILEIRFKYPGFRVFEVSAMAQVPIIRKY